MLRDKLLLLLFQDPKEDERLGVGQIRHRWRIWMSVIVGGGSTTWPPSGDCRSQWRRQEGFSRSGVWCVYFKPRSRAACNLRHLRTIP